MIKKSKTSMRSIASSGSSATPIANTMTTNLINSYQSATILNLSNSNDWECKTLKLRLYNLNLNILSISFKKTSKTN